MNRINLPLLPESVRWLGVITVVAVIVNYSLLTVPPAPPDGGGNLPLWDKRLHFLAYGSLVLSLSYATAPHGESKVKRRLAVVGGAIGIGLLIEIAQGKIPYRYFSFGDLVANSLGVLFGAVWLLAEHRVQYIPIRPLNWVSDISTR